MGMEEGEGEVRYVLIKIMIKIKEIMNINTFFCYL